MEKTTLQLFRIFMLLCAVTVVTLIWLGGPDVVPEFVPKIAFTLFVMGLANFLLWVTMVTYRFLDKKS